MCAMNILQCQSRTKFIIQFFMFDHKKTLRGFQFRKIKNAQLSWSRSTKSTWKCYYWILKFCQLVDSMCHPLRQSYVHKTRLIKILEFESKWVPFSELKSSYCITKKKLMNEWIQPIWIVFCCWLFGDYHLFYCLQYCTPSHEFSFKDIRLNKKNLRLCLVNS